MFTLGAYTNICGNNPTIDKQTEIIARQNQQIQNLSDECRILRENVELLQNLHQPNPNEKRTSTIEPEIQQTPSSPPLTEEQIEKLIEQSPVF